MGRHIRRLGSDPNLTCPSFMTANVPYGIAYPYLSPTLRHYNGFKTYHSFTDLLCLELLGIAYKPYTRISSLHDRRDYWYFGGVTTAPPVAALTPIQQLLLTIASIVLPTRILPLPAIPKALHLRFGVPPSPLHWSPFVIQRLSLGIPNSFDLTFLAHLSTLVQRIFTEFLVYICKSNYQGTVRFLISFSTLHIYYNKNFLKKQMFFYFCYMVRMEGFEPSTL